MLRVAKTNLKCLVMLCISTACDLDENPLLLVTKEKVTGLRRGIEELFHSRPNALTYLIMFSAGHLRLRVCQLALWSCLPSPCHVGNHCGTNVFLEVQCFNIITESENFQQTIDTLFIFIFIFYKIFLPVCLSLFYVLEIKYISTVQLFTPAIGRYQMSF